MFVRRPARGGLPIASVQMHHVDSASMLGQPGRGFEMALKVLEIFRPSVGAATLGFARRAMDEALSSKSWPSLLRMNRKPLTPE